MELDPIQQYGQELQKQVFVHVCVNFEYSQIMHCLFLCSTILFTKTTHTQHHHQLHHNHLHLDSAHHQCIMHRRQHNRLHRPLQFEHDCSPILHYPVTLFTKLHSHTFPGRCPPLWSPDMSCDQVQQCRREPCQ